MAGDNHDEAWDKGRYAAGVAARSGLFLRGDYVARMHLVGRAGLFAHELAHVSQTQLREGGRGARRSGSSKATPNGSRSACSTCSTIQLVHGVARSRRAHGRGLADAIKLFPDLPELSRQRQLGGVHEQAGRARRRIARRFWRWTGSSSATAAATVTEFLGRFALDSAPREHWAKVFPISYRQFAEEFRVRLENLAGSTPSAGEGNLGASQPSCG